MKSPFDCLTNARVAHWSYPAEITEREAKEKVRQFVENGINMILTENHRYILYDLKDPDNPPHFHFASQNRAQSLSATALVTDVCHRHGVKVLHHVTSSYCSEDLMREHPDWTQRDARFPDEPLHFDMYGGVWLFCLNNPRFRNTFFETVIEITKKTGVDGWMIDEVEWLPTWFSCGCGHCRDKFTRETGYVLPEGEDSSTWENFEDPIWRAWIRFRMKSAGDFFVDLKRLMDKETPGQILTACHAGASMAWLSQQWGADIIDYARGTNFIFYEAYINKGIPFHNWLPHLAEMKLYSAVARQTGYPVLTLFYGNSDAEMEFCWRMCMLSGHRQWVCRGPEHPGVNAQSKNLTNSTTYSPWAHQRSADYHPYFLAWEREHETLFTYSKPAANVALLFSKQTRDVYKGCDDDYYVNEFAGWAQALLETNVPYVMIIDIDLTSDYLSDFELLILPNSACLSNAQIEAIEDFIKGGRSVVATSETFQRDETGAMRTDLAPVNSLLAKCRYISEKIGQQCFLDYVRRDKPFEDKRNTAARDLLVGAVRKLAGPELPWSVEAPSGVVANVFILEGGSLAIHLLNCTGALVRAGETISTVDYALPFPEVRDVRIRIKEALVDGSSRFLLYTLDARQPTLIVPERSDGNCVLTVQEIGKGAVIHVTR